MASMPFSVAMTMRSSHCWAVAGVEAQGESQMMMRSNRSP